MPPLDSLIDRDVQLIFARFLGDQLGVVGHDGLTGEGEVDDDLRPQRLRQVDLALDSPRVRDIRRQARVFHIFTTHTRATDLAA